VLTDGAAKTKKTESSVRADGHCKRTIRSLIIELILGGFAERHDDPGYHGIEQGASKQ
jgi:hypothetical protein